MLNITIIILLPIVEIFHSHKYQRERKCFMVLPHDPVKRTCKTIFIQIWPPYYSRTDSKMSTFDHKSF